MGKPCEDSPGASQHEPEGSSSRPQTWPTLPFPPQWPSFSPSLLPRRNHSVGFQNHRLVLPTFEFLVSRAFRLLICVWTHWLNIMLRNSPQWLQVAVSFAFHCQMLSHGVNVSPGESILRLDSEWCYWGAILNNTTLNIFVPVSWCKCSTWIDNSKLHSRVVVPIDNLTSPEGSCSAF